MSRKRSSRRQHRAAAKNQQRAIRQSRPQRGLETPKDLATAARARFLSVAIAVVLLAMVAVIYFPVHSYEFTSLDDPQYVSANAIVRQGLTWVGVRWAFAFTSSFYWHPLTWMSHMLDVQLFAVNPGAHHVVNAAIHAANTVLLFAALYRMTRAAGRSAFVAALFAVHPLHVESVAWIAERKDVLSTLFWMAALYAYTAYAKERRRRQMLWVTLLFAAGLLAKPMILTLPFVLLLLDYWPLRRLSLERANRGSTWLQLVTEKLPLFGLASASVVVTMLSQRGSRAVIALEALPVTARIGNAIVSYAVYLRYMLWPSRLAAFYPLIPPPVTTVVIASAVLALLMYLAVTMSRSRPYIFVGWFWYLGTLLPVIGLIQAGDQGRADRFTYVPLVGLFIVIAWGATEVARRLSRGRTVLAVMGGATAAVLAFAAHAQLKWWKNDLTLWGRAVQVTHGSYRAENLYGVALTDRGRLAEGIEHYSAALAIWPDYPEGHNNLGTARMEQGRVIEAIREFSAAVRVKPNNATFRYNLAVALNAAGRRAEAIRELRTALESHPGNADLLRALQVFSSELPQ